MGTTSGSFYQTEWSSEDLDGVRRLPKTAARRRRHIRSLTIRADHLVWCDSSISFSKVVPLMLHNWMVKPVTLFFPSRTNVIIRQQFRSVGRTQQRGAQFASGRRHRRLANRVAAQNRTPRAHTDPRTGPGGLVPNVPQADEQARLRQRRFGHAIDPLSTCTVIDRYDITSRSRNGSAEKVPDTNGTAACPLRAPDRSRRPPHAQARRRGRVEKRHQVARTVT
jgi:hypothetical protein